MSFFDLFFLGAGGVIGSGWLLGTKDPGKWAVLSWLLGGALILVITAVMVELSTRVPKTGGLVFLPLQASGPLLATVVAGALVAFYAVNPASEAIAMVRGLAATWHGGAALVTGAQHDRLTRLGLGWAALFLVLIAAVNLLGPRLFLMLNNVLTAFKILVPLMIVALLGYTWLVHADQQFPPLDPGKKTTYAVTLSAAFSVVSGVVIYAYLGFQGPLDFAGNVRRRGIGEARRLRWAVYGTVCGSILLYVALQVVVGYMNKHHGSGHPVTEPFAAFVAKVAPGWLEPLAVWLVRLDTVLSPAGAGMVFTYALTREVAALSRAHLMHRGLQHSRFSVIPLATPRLRRLFGDDRLDVYWLILIVDLALSVVALLASGGQWELFGGITSVLALVVYSAQGVVLAALRRREPERFPQRRYAVLAQASFVAISVVICLAPGSELGPAMVALAAGCLLLFGLPLALSGSRWYDATAHARRFRRLSADNPAARSATLLLGYFAGLAATSSLVNHVWRPERPPWAVDIAGLTVLAVLASIVFRRLVALSISYMRVNQPTLPTPSPPLRRGKSGRRAPAGATERS